MKVTFLYKRKTPEITKFGIFQAVLSQNSDSKSCHKGVGWWHIWCIHPFGHHLKAGEVFLQGFQFAAVAAEDDARSGDHRSPSEEGKAALDFLQLAIPCRGVALCEDRFINRHDDVPVKLNKLNKVATDEVVKFLQGFVAFFDILNKDKIKNWVRQKLFLCICINIFFNLVFKLKFISCFFILQ